MDAVLRGLVIYIVLLVIFRLAGRRSLSEITTFDFILLLIIGETTQQALLGRDFSMMNAIILILTLILADMGIAILKKSPSIDKWLEGTPTILVQDGRLLEERTKKLGVDKDDILEAARELQGLERLDQIKYAVLERRGNITIIPQPEQGS